MPRIQYAFGIAAALLVAGCATTGPRTAAFEDAQTVRASIEIIDPVTRQVLLRGQDGRIVSVFAGPEVRNFDRLKAGDVVVVAFAESVTARMAQPGDVVATRAGAAAERAPVGSTPGAAAGTAIQSVVTWVSYDPATAIATFTGPTGISHSVPTPESMRAFAATRRPGDRVAIEYSTAVAIGIEPAGS